ncbi:hypothetical protein CDD83_7699 [Cordyceps sp. RAO-2017]|nr:hypothetical protein CDD83_7699 [Cordyceps sp. RAO-2017]
MDIHRCRFVPYQPSAINAVAFSHPKAKSAIHGAIAKLAVGRANGDIEIWNPSSGTWHQELVIRGGKGRSIDGLVWVNDLDQDLEGGRVVVGRSRLFSIGYTSTITEWDLEKGKPKRHASAQHGDIWCLAAQPAGPAGVGGSDGTLPSNKLLAGTVHGELAMYSVEDGDLRFQRMLVKSPTKRVHMVSMTFQSRKMVIVGCADSTIRAYDLTHGHMVRRMTLGSDLVGGAKHIIVWSVKCLPNGNIVSGDSTGQICIWDGKTYTQTQRIQSHKQDVLSLAISADGNSIMSGGMDRRTFLYKQNDDGGRWSKAWGRRYHNHDVKAMASFEFKSMSVVVSGGPDAHLTVVPLKEMRRENHRNMSCLPQQPPIASASNARFMVSWWDRQVHVWALRRPATELFKSAADEVNINENRKLLKSIVIKGDSNITSAAVDKDGRFLVVSTATDVKAFHLRHRAPAKPCDVAVAAVELPHKLSHLGASRVVLSPDGRWLCLIQEGSRVLMAVVDAGDQDSPSISGQPQRLTRLHREVPRYILNGGLGSYDRNITQVAFSADSEMLAVADLAGFIDTWVLRTAEGARRKGGGGDSADEDEAASSSDSSSSASGDEAERWIRNPAGKQLPKLPSVPVVLSFSDHMPGRQGQQASRQEEADGTGDYVLAAITTSWHVLAFHPRRGSLTTGPGCGRTACRSS